MSEAEAIERTERAICAWLYSEARQATDDGEHEVAEIWREAAFCIERGLHLPFLGQEKPANG